MPATLAQLKVVTGATQPDPDLQLYLDQGALVVSEYLSGPEALSISDGVKDSIALYLAAHFWVLSYEGGGITYSRVGQSEEKYHGIAADKVGFQTTRFGQMACSLDSTGILAQKSVGNQSRFMFANVGHDDANTAL